MGTECWKTNDPEVMRSTFQTLLTAIEVVEASNDERKAIEAVVLNVGDLGYPNVMISLLDETTRPAMIRACEAFGKEWEAIKGETVREYPGEDILARVLERGEAKFVANSRDDSECDRQAIEKSGIVTQYVIPLLTQDMRIGTMQVHLGDCRAKPELACKMLDALAAHLSMAISRLRALDRLREANEVIMGYSKFAVANEVAAAMIHQLYHEIDEFDTKLTSRLKQQGFRENRVAYEVLTDLQREVGSWKQKLDKPLEFVRVKELKQTCSLAAIVRDSVAYWYEIAAAKKCRIRVSVVDEGIVVEIQPSQLKEALSCLVINALQAHAHVIEITIARSLAYLGAEPEECGIVRVADDGEGIPEALVSEVFKQGFTTKRKYGTGMGLFMVKRLARAMSGDAYFESGGKSSGKLRTVFQIAIPTVPK